MSRTLTYQHLVNKGACSSSLAKFRALFGDAVEVTEELAFRHATDFPWHWAADNLLSAPARAEYWRAKVAAYAEYKRATSAAYTEYEHAMSAADAEYEPAIILACTEYDRDIASTWARLYMAEK